MSRSVRNRLRVSLLAAVLAAAIVPASASADGFTVNTTGDNGPALGECNGGANECSLRQAIDRANNSSGDDVIDFDLPDHSTISLTNGPLLVNPNEDNQATDIEGPGADQLTIDLADGSGPSEVIDFGHPPNTANSKRATRRTPIAVPPGVNALTGVTITGGNSFPEQAAGINSDLELLLQGVVVTGNTATAFDATGAVGGVLNSSLLAVINSTISNNSVLASNGSSGGGLGNFGALFMVNSTVAGNKVTGANSAGSGGGIWSPVGEVKIVNATVSGNSAAGVGAGSGVFNDGQFDLGNSILAQNTGDGADCENTGDMGSQGYNIVGNDANCDFTHNTGDQVGTQAAPLDALLGPLAITDGSTPVMPLLQGSPAIDNGNPATPADNTSTSPPDLTPCFTTDQRGVDRPQRTTCDVGAFETRAPLAATTGDGVGLGPTTGGVSGSVTPGVLAADVHFEYGTSPAYGTSTAVQHVAPGDSAVAQVANLAGLTPNTIYHFRIVAQNVDGTVVGSDRTFKTAAAATDPAPEFGLLDVKDVTIDKDGNVIIPGLFVGCPQAGGPCNVTALIQTLGKVSGKVVAAKHKKKARRHVLGTRTYGVPQGSITEVKVKLSKGTLRLLKKHGKIKATVHIVITALGSHKQSKIDKKFVIHARKGKKKKHAHAASASSRTSALRRAGVLDFFAAHRHSAPAKVRWPVRAFR